MSIISIRKPEKKLNTLFVKLMCFTAIITILSVIFAGMFPYIYLQNEMSEDIKQFNNQKLEKLKDTLEINLFDVTVSFLSDFVNTSDIYNIINTMENGEGKINAYSIIELQTLLRSKITPYSDLFNDILLYHEKDRKIISASMGVQNLDDKSQKMQKNDEWVKQIEDLSPHRTIKWLYKLEVPDFNSNNFSSTLKCIAIIIRVKTKLHSGSLVYVCITIPETKILELMRKVNPDKRIHMELMKANGDCIISTESVSGQVQLEIPIESGFLPQKEEINSEVYDNIVYSIMKSDTNDWYYLMETPRDYYYKRMDTFNKNVIIASIFVFVLMCSISMFVIFRLTSPFGDLLKIVSKLKRPIGNERKKTEMRLVADVFSGLVETSNLQQQLLLGNRALVRQSLITQFLTGIKISSDEIKSCIKFLDMKFNFHFYTVVAMQFISLHNENSIEFLSTLEHYIKENKKFNAEFIKSK